jgi:hypothetical protein
MKRYLALFLFAMAATLVFAQEPNQSRSGSSLSNTSLQYGYKGIAEMGYLLDISNHGMNRFKMNAIIACQINPHFSLGLGTGFQYYFDAEDIVIPLFADVRTNLTDINDKVSPYLSLGIGVSLGMFINPTVGVSFKMPNKSVLNVGLGYEIQKMRFQYDNYRQKYELKTEDSGAINIVIGIHR